MSASSTAAATSTAPRSSASRRPTVPDRLRAPKGAIGQGCTGGPSMLGRCLDTQPVCCSRCSSWSRCVRSGAGDTAKVRARSAGRAQRLKGSPSGPAACRRRSRCPLRKRARLARCTRLPGEVVTGPAGVSRWGVTRPFAAAGWRHQRPAGAARRIGRAALATRIGPAARGPAWRELRNLWVWLKAPLVA